MAKSYVIQANPASADEYTWHRRFGRMNYAYLKEAQNPVQGMAITKGNRPATFEACITARQQRQPQKVSAETASGFGDLIVSDVVGAPSMTPSIMISACELALRGSSLQF